MRPIYEPHEPTAPPLTLRSVFFPKCCPHRQEPSKISLQPCFKKQKIFITLSKHLIKEVNKSKQERPKAQRGKPKQPPQELNFQEDKVSFLEQIRNYSPSLELQKMEHQQPTAIFDSSKDIHSSSKSNDINLSSFLDSLNNQMFSDLFVSESVKGKIVVSGSLGSITEVKSDLQISERQQIGLGSLLSTEREKRKEAPH